MSGSESQPAKPYQGPQFDLQNNVLSSYVLGNMLRQNPWAFGGARADQNIYGQAAQLALPGFSAQQTPKFSQTSVRPVDSTMSPLAQQLAQQNNRQTFSKTMPTQGQPIQRINAGFGPMTVNGQHLAPQNSNTNSGFYNAGQTIPGQIQSNIISTGVGPSLTSNTTPLNFGKDLTPTINPETQYQNFQFKAPNVQFAQRSPYQISPINNVNVSDTYNPQYQMARRDILDQSKISQEQQLSDLNRRGLLTTGGATRALDLQRQEQDRKLANLASQYSIEQGRAQLQEDQLQRQMEMQRQIEQAAELFRQQGASDAQAQFLANQNFNVQNAQAAQNLAGYQANLGTQQQRFEQGLSSRNLSNAERQLQLAQQGQAFQQNLSGRQQTAAERQLQLAQLSQQFQQNLSGRQQATAEEQLANFFRRQPIEDLFKMWQQQAGPTGGTQGSPGILGALGPIAGAVAGNLIAPGVGGAAGAALGGSLIGGAL